PALHAWRLAFHHPIDDRALAFEAPLPPDLRDLWRTTTGRSLDEDVRGDHPR
ncbi:MAG: RNA pseudouridine synthase, partial [Thermoanaerobaculia bacterium]|nr:RNA pseudouridine synthase [Thermoanaerobaculia bacterium]